MSPIRSWRQLVCRYPHDQDCLAGFFAWHSAEVLAGAKPSNLFNVLKRTLPCGRDMAVLWQEHAAPVARRAGLSMRVLRESDTRLLVLVYHPGMLERTLDQPEVALGLERYGYPSHGLEGRLDVLCRRMGVEAIPHEIGFFLGYPVKDVRAFIGEIDLPLACRGPWVMYGDPSESLATARAYQSARERVRARLAEASSPRELLVHPRELRLEAA